MLTIHFYLRYTSSFGQSFFVTGDAAVLGGGQVVQAVPMQYLNHDFWHASIQVDTAAIPTCTYHYGMVAADGSSTNEWGNDRCLDLTTIVGEQLQVIDTWNYAGEYQNAFYTQPFQQTLLPKPSAMEPMQPSTTAYSHVFKVKSPLLTAHQTLCLLGSHPQLGSWDTQRPLLLQQQGHWFTTSVDLTEATFPIAYKYGVWDREAQVFVQYEDGENRILNGPGSRRQVTILHDGFAYLPNTTFKGAGVAIPVFSLRSEQSFGVGEFADIPLLADWAKSTGLKLIQLLPLNDTTATHTWVDSYPYAAISAFALHPLYINLARVAGTAHAAMLAPLHATQQLLNALPQVDYEQVTNIKYATLKKLYRAMREDWLADAGYQAFYQQHQHWLLPYAVFCYLRDENQTVAFANWKKLSVYDAVEVAKLASPKSKVFDKVAIHLFTQYHLHLQLLAAVSYAHTQGIVMKGDIPIGVYRHSCDAWVNPDLFNMDAQAGAPPDDFAVKGQNWGFPTYNWQRMQDDGFSWWKQRFEQMSLYFDAFRIDHILGFFRIWSIPMDAVEGILGRFSPAIPVFRTEFAEKGIWFDKDRYCKPFINDVVLKELFGIKAEWVKQTFTENENREPYHLKETYNTQRKIAEWFATQTDVEGWIKEKLFDLVSNVILIAEPNSEDAAYHFRICMDQTSSYRYLDTNTQMLLRTLYVDYFFRRQDAFWGKQALQKLPALKASTNMLICGEDLGMVPDCVPGIMKDLGLLSLEIQRMPKDSSRPFFNPKDAPYLSVVTPSTHDMSTIRGWWQEDEALTQQFYNSELDHLGAAPYFCDALINKEIIVLHLYSPAMWSIFQLQDLLGSDELLRGKNPEDERINIPANPQHYWRYRMHFTLENLLLESAFNNELREFVHRSGR